MRQASLCLLALTIFVSARANGDDQTASEVIVIESALGSLKQAKSGNEQLHAALAEFERAFNKLKQDLVTRPSADVDRDQHGHLVDTHIHTINRDTLIPSDGRVLLVDRENKQVLLSTGRKDGVKKGQRYRVYQSGKFWPDQTAWIRITKVESQWSIGTIVHEYSPRATMQRNDIIQRDEGEEPNGQKVNGRKSKNADSRRTNG
jgi:hypothetical protein